MSSADVELVAAARALLAGAYVAGRHEVVAAMRMSDGSIQLGVHVDGSARRSSVCAECVAAGNVFAHAATTGAVPDVVACVAVLRLPGDTEHVIEPCGVCAELITDYWPDARVWVTRGGETRAVTAAELLPAKRRRGW
ncbi:cytidine deaminase [Microbacterium indicum]|uniref:cytidine deaminase n=1 Tax=Microbacterium indicum TaxID=358100 RepID=UPI00041AD068|nr:cytidine deaminase [Microbacterium indicum]